MTPDTIDITYVRDASSVRLVGRMTLHSPAGADEALQVLSALRPLLDGRSVRLDIDSVAVRPMRPPAVHTPPEPQPVTHPLPVGEGEAAAEPPAAPKPAQPSLQPNADPSPIVAFSAERMAILKREFTGGRPVLDILLNLNALPGPFLNAKQVTNKASNSGLRRPNYLELAASPASQPSPPPAVPPAEADDDLEPVNASMSEILAWARSEGGFLKTEGAPLTEVNAQRIALSLPPFHLVGSGGRYNGEDAHG